MISVVILSKNEEENIEDCLKTLLWCDEIIVVDDYSQDETVKKIQNLQFKVQKYKTKIKVFFRKLNNNFSAQRNFGLSKTSFDWVLFIDADERVTAQLKKEILSICHFTQYETVGYFIKRQDYFLGRRLNYGETGNSKFIRLVKKGTGRWRGKIHEVWETKGKIGQLINPILHYPHPTIGAFITKINFYTDIVIRSWIKEKRKIAFWEIIFYPLGKFIYNYIFRLGFLDGIQGFIMAVIMSFHSFLARAKWWAKYG